MYMYIYICIYYIYMMKNFICDSCISYLLISYVKFLCPSELELAECSLVTLDSGHPWLPVRARSW